MDKKTTIAFFLFSAALCAGAGTQTLESKALVVRADPTTGEFSVRDKRTGREWGVALYKFDSDYTGAVVMAGCGGDKGGTSEADQAEYIMRSIEIARQFGVERYFIYEFRSPGNDPYYSEDHFGIVQRVFTPKAAYEALRLSRHF